MSTRRQQSAASRSPSSSDPSFDWGGTTVPRESSLARARIYERHVKRIHEAAPGGAEDLRGTYAGLASDGARVLPDLGVNAGFDRLFAGAPIADEEVLHERGLTKLLGVIYDRHRAQHALYAETSGKVEQVRGVQGP